MDHFNEIEAIKSEAKSFKLASQFIKLVKILWSSKKNTFNRILPLGEYFSDRHEKAKFMGFGRGTTLYDTSVVLGNVIVGENTWIGPFVVLDGSGELSIGSHCSISAGVQIYSHDSVEWAVSGGKEAYQYAPTIIEDNCYIGPNTIIQKGVRIGQGSIIGANSLVNKNIPPHSKAYGSPIKIIDAVQREPV
jgi:acetyltransferase-like isoleucine patch superfamily enzyme